MVLEDVSEEKQVAHAATMLTSNALSCGMRLNKQIHTSQF